MTTYRRTIQKLNTSEADTIYTQSSDSYYTIVRDPKDPSKDYQLPADVAEVLYASGKLEYDTKTMLFCTPGIDDPEIGVYKYVPVSISFSQLEGN